MKSKKTTYLLIALVIGIWGYVGYSLFKPEEEFIIEEVSDYKTIESEIKLADSIQLDLSYKDPFLERTILTIGQNKSGLQNKARKNYNRTVQPKKQSKPKNEEFINWPNIKYAGTINESLALVKFNGKKTFIKQNDVFNGFKTISFNSDSLVIMYKNKTRSYSKNK